MQELHKKIIRIVAACAVLALIVILSIFLAKSMSEVKRLRSNADTEMSCDFQTQQTFTKAELKEYFQEEVSKLKEYGIKARQVENIVNVRYTYRDTTIYRDTLIYVYDTVLRQEAADFDITGKCWAVCGTVYPKNIEIHDVDICDDILISLYREKRKCLFSKRKVKAIAISSCSGDTLKILRNIKVEK